MVMTMKELLGKKIGMTRVFAEDGSAVPVTVIEAGPCLVVSRKNSEKHGYEALVVGFEPIEKKRLTKPRLGLFEKNSLEPTRYLKEIRYDGGDIETGEYLKVDLFKAGERVDVTGVSRGLGFQGTMRRHNFSGSQETHGQSDRKRAPGSIGQSSYPSRVFKGMKMAGKTGKDRITVLNLEVIKVIEEQNLLLVKGAVPGKKGTLVKIRNTNRAI